jgi:hypothetical protein
MGIPSFAIDAGLLLAAAAGLVLTLIAIVRDTEVRRHSPATAHP